MAVPTHPATYAWEATDEEVARRYGLPASEIVRFDLNTSPATPPYVAGLLASMGSLALHEYPAADYRTLVEAAAATYGVRSEEVGVGAGADEVLDLCAKAFLPPGGVAVSATPTYAMYRVLTEQRGARLLPVPRLGPAEGYAIDLRSLQAAARGADLVWLCSPNNPTGLAEPPGAIAELLDGLEADAGAAGPPTVVLDEAYAEYTGRSLLELRLRHPRLVVVRTLSKAYALAGFRVGFAVAVPPTIQALARYRPPGSVSIVSAAVAEAGLRDPRSMRDTVALVASERDRVRETLLAAGWTVGPSVTNFLLLDLATPERAAGVADALLRAGLVPRTFGSDHPLAGHLRITVRLPGENDRLLAALDGIGPEARA